MGRKPIPRAFRVLHGNPSKRPLPENEPQPEASMPECPAFIQGEGRAQWDRIGPMLLNLGVLTEMDAIALSMLANSLGRWVKAEMEVETTGGAVLTSAEGGLYQNPHLSVANKAWDQLHKMLCEFGMTPSSRSKVTSTKGGKKQSEFESDSQQYA